MRSDRTPLPLIALCERAEWRVGGDKPFLVGLGVGGYVDKRAQSGTQVHPALAMQALQRPPEPAVG